MTAPLIFDWAALAAALGGTAIGGLIDLKTTEVPDAVPLGMALAGAGIYASRFLLLGDYISFLWGLAVAAAFLAFGYLLYFSGQWGEADVLLLGAVGFLIPQPLSMFNPTGLLYGAFYPVIFLLNMFLTGAAYSIAYAFGLALRTADVFVAFGRDIRKRSRSIAILAAAVSGVSVAAALYLTNLGHPPSITLPVLSTIPLVVSLALLYRFAVVLEKTVFRKKIPTSKLRVGDVLAEDVRIGKRRISSKLYIGLTRAQIAAIRKTKASVVIKEGIRYSPVFFLSILVTLFFGNLLWPLFVFLI